MVARMLEHLARAADAADLRAAVGALLDAWRDAPAPVLGDFIEKLTPAAAGEADEEDILQAGTLLLAVRDVSAALAVEKIGKLDRLKDDPRVASACCTLLEDPPYHATGSKPFWTRLWALAAANRDPRSI